MKRKNQKGSIILSFMLLIFVSVVGTTLITFCILHTRSVKARTFRLVETDKIYQSLVYYLHQFREKVFKERVQDFLNPETECFNSVKFPDVVINNEHFVSHSFGYVHIPRENYTKTRVTAGLAVSAASPKDNNYCIASEVFIDILSGQIPLTVFPFFMNKEIGSPTEPKDVETFLKENNIANKSNKNPVVEELEVELGHGEFLLDALKISGNVIGWREIREKFALPPSDSPIPEGIHILVAGNAVESIFIQGDVERLVFSAGSQLQEIRIIQNTTSYELSYKPKENYFSCWDYSVAGETLFKEKIIVNGSIWSLEQEGEGAFSPQSNIRLLVTGRTVIASSLVTVPDQLNLRANLFANLTLSCGIKYLDQLSRLDLEIPAVVVGGDSIRLQAAIIVEGKFVNNSSELQLSGSLYCEDLDNRGTMDIHSLPTVPVEDNYYHTVDFKYIAQFLIHFIEEV